MKKKCPNCDLVNFASAENCLRCRRVLVEVAGAEFKNKAFFSSKLFRRAAVCLAITAATIFAFYFSLILTAKPLEYEEKKTIERGIALLEEKGFSSEVILLRYLTVYRGSDHWLNASTRFENAYAATNFPFEIMTVYPDFFLYPNDDVERAAILLHEAKHLQGGDEKEAYTFVWQNRKRLGWTKENYAGSVVWRNVRKQTKEVVPELFVCSVNDYGDCTE